jgi:hypothetical protein
VLLEAARLLVLVRGTVVFKPPNNAQAMPVLHCSRCQWESRGAGCALLCMLALEPMPRCAALPCRGSAQLLFQHCASISNCSSMLEPMEPMDPVGLAFPTTYCTFGQCVGRNPGLWLPVAGTVSARQCPTLWVLCFFYLRTLG